MRPGNFLRSSSKVRYFGWSVSITAAIFGLLLVTPACKNSREETSKPSSAAGSALNEQGILVSAGKTLLTVQAVPKGPDNSVTEFQAGCLENGIEENIERIDLAFLDIVPNLPANGPVRVQEAHSFLDRFALGFEVRVERTLCLTLFAEIVGRRRNDQLHARIGQRTHEDNIVLTRNNGILRTRLCQRDPRGFRHRTWDGEQLCGYAHA